MKAAIVQIGNSKGLRLPKAILAQCELTEEVELEVAGKQLIVRSVNHPRQKWKEAFQRMARQGDDQLLDQEVITSSWDQEEWAWE